jgi:hypothetical protein
VSEIRLGFLGSCVTADVFRAAEDLPRPVFTCSRTSLVSIMSAPLELADGDLRPRSGFAARTIAAEFRKTFLDELEAARCDYLIVDFVDERWDLLRHGSSFVTRSLEQVEAGIDHLARYTLERLPRLGEETQRLWLDAAVRFADELRGRLPELQVVLHRALGVEHYRAGQEVRRQGAYEAGIPLGLLNRVLTAYYDWFAALARPVELGPAGDYLADPGHRWGLSPFHYEEQYYLDLAAALRRLPQPSAVPTVLAC